MLLAFLAVLAGLALLVWSADRFVDGAAATARYLGMPPLLIGMVIVGFGTSAPEMAVAGLSAWQGNPGLALGNAYGSNIANIALILGVTALISPIAVQSGILRRELPVLTLVTGLSVVLLGDRVLARFDAWVLLGAFVVLMGWSIGVALRGRGDVLGQEMEGELESHDMPLSRALTWVVVGVVLLVVSSRLLVWGAVIIAQEFGISDLIIGLTVVAIGTSLPELAAAVMAARKGEHDLALGNVLGSNLFNTLTVVGIAGAIHPTVVPNEVLSRDMLVMGLLTVSMFAICYGFGGRPGRINRIEGGLLLAVFIGYTGYLVAEVVAGH